jgi:hypothetical protein
MIQAPFPSLIHVNHPGLISVLGGGDHVYALALRFNMCETRARRWAMGRVPSAQVEMIHPEGRKQRRRMLGGLWASVKKTLTRPRPTRLRARRTISLGGRAGSHARAVELRCCSTVWGRVWFAFHFCK